jgi:hypothetical protein
VAAREGGEIGRGGGIWTPDIQLPKLAHYQAVQHPAKEVIIVSNAAPAFNPETPSVRASF